jgi:hypothetical protein
MTAYCVYEEEIAEVKEKLHTIRTANAKERIEYDREVVQQYQAKQDVLRQRLYKSRPDLSLYTQALLDCGDVSISPYVLRREATLCQIVHRMAMEEYLVQLVKDQSMAIIQNLKQDLQRIQDEEAEIEVALLNQIALKAFEVNRMKAEQEKTLDEQREILESIAVRLDERIEQEASSLQDDDEQDEGEFMFDDFVKSLSSLENSMKKSTKSKKNPKNNRKKLYVPFVKKKPSPQSPVSVRATLHKVLPPTA